MTRILTPLIQTTVALVFALGAAAQAADKKPDPTGTWKWSFTTQNGQTRETTAKLKVEGDKLTGSVSGRQNDTPIEDAKLNGEDISFKVTREFNGNKIIQKFAGKISGDTIKGKIETDRNGENSSRDWEAKRSTDK